MNTDMSMITLVLEASPIVQAVMVLLLLASLISWAIIIAKVSQLGRARKAANRFEETFWAGGDVSDIYRRLKPQRGNLRGLERLFEAGFSEYGRLSRGDSDADAVLAGSRRSMRLVLSRETDEMEQSLSFLATVGSVSPYIGLFGTVWGIMNSFRALGNVQQATLAMVAPGIAEALIATAIGLFAAIPAVIFYNRFANQIDRTLSRYENFAEEFSNLLNRQLHSRRTQGGA